MPVDVLLCEGAENGPDLRILKKILTGHCGEIKAMGGKYGMGTRVMALREARPGARIAALLDGDFQQDWFAASAAPRPWESDDGNLVFGWRWARKEIENYLIDPIIVAKSLGRRAVGDDGYRALLDEGVEHIAIYQAARTALSNCRRRFQDLPSGWGRPRGKERHPFPDSLDLAACTTQLRDVALKHAAEQIVSTDDVVRRFTELLPEFAVDGVRRRDFLWTFAGKDLLVALESGLQGYGFASVRAFREYVLLGIESTLEDIATWLPEWAALRSCIEAFSI